MVWHVFHAAGDGGAAGEGGGSATLSQIIPDERTNKLIVIASPAGFERIMALVREIDIPISGEGRINVYYLENANAEDVASTLQTLAQGTANRPKTAAPPPPGAPGKSGAAQLFSGEVKVSADKATNSLVIIASQADYRSLVRVVEKLDIRRRQVFVEGVIMEVNLDRNSDLGINLHGGLPLPDGQGGTMPVFFGTKYGSGSGLPPSLSIANLINMGYNLFAMVHGSLREECSAKAGEIRSLLGDACRANDILYSTKILKKTGLRIGA